MLVFIPAIGEYVIPELLGGRTQFLLVEFYGRSSLTTDWPLASAVAQYHVNYHGNSNYLVL